MNERGLKEGEENVQFSKTKESLRKSRGSSYLGTVPSLPVYSSLVFGTLAKLCSHHHNQF